MRQRGVPGGRQRSLRKRAGHRHMTADFATAVLRIPVPRIGNTEKKKSYNVVTILYNIVTIL